LPRFQIVVTVEEGIFTGLKLLFYIENGPSASGLVPKPLHAKFRRALKAGFFVSQNLENSEDGPYQHPQGFYHSS
jgi:hypothetical protein